jgi:GDP-mannose 4,6-dehydratase
MKFLITGITGFAGPHLANLLHEQGHEIYGLVRHSNGRENDIRDIVVDDIYKDITFINSDLVNYRVLQDVFKDTQFDGVFHLAAQSHPPTSFIDPIGTWDSNVTGSVNLIQAIIDHQPNCKLMFCSTSEVYGNLGKDGKKIHWDSKLFPANPYGASKAAIDMYLQERMESGAIKGFITRAFSHTGTRRGKNFSISSDAYQIARMMLQKQDSKLLIGNLDSVRVVIDVRDAVKAYYMLMMDENSNKGIYNVCGDTPHKMRHFTDKLVEHSGLTDVEYVVHKPFWRPIDIHYQNGDTANLREQTGWSPVIDIDETLRGLLQYWVKKIG